MKNKKNRKTQKSRKRRKNRKSKKNNRFFLDVISLNNKGQIVIPAKLRKEMNLKNKSRLLLLSNKKEAIILIKVKAFAERIKKLEKLTKKIKLT